LLGWNGIAYNRERRSSNTPKAPPGTLGPGRVPLLPGPSSADRDVQLLAGIAVDRSAPAGARVAACRTLLGLSEGSDARMVAEDTVAERAIRLMAAARKAH